MVFFGGAFFGGGFFAPLPAGGRPWEQRWRQELADLIAQEDVPKEEKIEVPRRVRRAMARVLEAAPADDSAAVKALRTELASLKVTYRPQYGVIVRQVMKPAFDFERDDEEVLLLLH